MNVLISLALLVGIAQSALAGAMSELDENGSDDRSKLTWRQFNLAQRVSLPVSKDGPAIFYVKYPCELGAKYKVFLRVEAGGATLGHVEIYKNGPTSDLTGNLYCKGAGSKSWHGGEKIDFNLKCDALKCKDGMKQMKVEKTTKSVKLIDVITNELLWSKVFSRTSGDCLLATGALYTQAWEYTGNELSIAQEGQDEEEKEDKDEDEKEEDEEEEEKEENDEEEKEELTCKWITAENMKLMISMPGPQYAATAAMVKCEADANCRGISCNSDGRCMLNAQSRGKFNNKFTAYVKIC